MTTFKFERETNRIGLGRGRENVLRHRRACKRRSQRTVVYQAPGLDILASLLPARAGPPDSKAALATWPRRWTRSRIVRYGVLATVVSLLIALTIILGKHGNLGASVAFADVQEAVRQTKTAVITMIYPLQPELNTKVYLLGTNQSRKEQNGLVFIHDRTKQQMLVLSPGDKTAWFTHALRLGDPWSSLDPNSQDRGESRREVGPAPIRREEHWLGFASDGPIRRARQALMLSATRLGSILKRDCLRVSSPSRPTRMIRSRGTNVSSSSSLSTHRWRSYSSA